MANKNAKSKNKAATDNKKKFGAPLVVILCIIIALETITIALGAGFLISQNSNTNNDNTDNAAQSSTTAPTDATNATEATLAVEEGKFDSSVNGIWKEEKATSDITFFWTIDNNSFIMEGGNGYGNSRVEYTVNCDSDKKVMEVVSAGSSLAVYNYSVDGDKLTLELANNTSTDSTDGTSVPENNTVTLVKVDKVDLPEINKRDDFEVNEELIGKWENSEQGRVFEFREDGILSQENMAGVQSVFTSAYTYDGKTVFVYSSADETVELACTVKDGKMSLKDDEGNTLDLTKAE